MGSKVNIANRLYKLCNSAIWQKLKSSLIGREVLSAGTEMVYMNQTVKDSFANSMFIDRADGPMLINTAYVNDCMLDMCEPAWIKVQFVSTGEPIEPFIAKPFSLQYTVGSVTFTNVDFVDITKPLILYQGRVRYTNTTPNKTLEKFRTDMYQNFTLYSQLTSLEYYSSYVKLGTQAVSHSVRVFAQLADDTKITPVFPYTEYSPLYAGSDMNLYKVRTGWDASVNVLFGNSKWGSPFNSSYDYTIYWLEGSIGAFSAEVGDNISVIYSAPAANFPYTAEVLSSGQGSLNDLSYMRDYLHAQMGQGTVIATEAQIRSFVNSQSPILDCRVLRTGNNELSVYVKPTLYGDDYFDDIVDMLTTYGEIVVTWKVITGSPFMFNVRLSSLQPLTQATKDSIVAYLTQQLSYSNLAYQADISSIRLTELVAQQGTPGVNASVEIEEVITTDGDIQLALPPYRGSISLWNTVGGQLVKVGWDSESHLYANTGTTVFKLPNIRVGHFLINTDGPNVFNPTNFVQTDNSVSLSPLKNMTGTLTSLNRVIAYNKVGNAYNMVMYALDSSFEDGDYSVQHSPTVMKPFVASTAIGDPFTPDPDVPFNPDLCLFRDNHLYTLVQTGGVWSFLRYDYEIVEQVNGMYLHVYPVKFYGVNVQMPQGGTPVGLGVVDSGTDTVLICTTAGFTAVTNFSTDPKPVGAMGSNIVMSNSNPNGLDFSKLVHFSVTSTTLFIFKDDPTNASAPTNPTTYKVFQSVVPIITSSMSRVLFNTFPYLIFAPTVSPNIPFTTVPTVLKQELDVWVSVGGTLYGKRGNTYVSFANDAVDIATILDCASVDYPTGSIVLNNTANSLNGYTITYEAIGSTLGSNVSQYPMLNDNGVKWS